MTGPVLAARPDQGAGSGEAGPPARPVQPGRPAWPTRLDRLDVARATGALLAVIGFVVGSRAIADNSFLTHLATGRLILDTGSLPRVDPYSALAAGQPWTVQSWLVSLVYAVTERLAGLWAIRLENGLVGAAVTLGLWRLVAPARQLLVRVALVAAVVLTGTALWPPRPLLYGLGFLVLTLQVVQGLRRPWWLVPVFALWVNCHGSFVLGLGLLGAVAVGAALDQRRWPGAEIRLGLLAALGCLGAVANPLGWRLLWFPVQLMGRSGALRGVAEWSAPGFRSGPELLFAALLVVVVISARRRGRWRELLPALAFFAAGLLAVRNLGLASIVIVALGAPGLAGAARGTQGEAVGPPARLLGLAALLAAAASVVVAVSGPALDLSPYPVAQVDWLEARSLIGDRSVTLAEREVVGNYLTFRYGARARVFMDDRFDFYPRDVIADHNTLVLGGDLAEVLERRRVDVVLWSRPSPLYRWLARDPGWQVVSQDDAWFVACRVDSPAFARCTGPR